QAGGIENGTGFWSLMSAGSWLSDGKVDTGSKPSFMGPWEKLFLGWLNHYTIKPDSGTTYSVLGPAGDANGPRAQAVVVNLPDQTVTDEYNTPYEGQYEWWGGSADNLNVSLTRDLDLTGATSASVTAKLQHEIEADYDYLYGEVSTNGGTSWSIVPWKTVNGDVERTGTQGLDGSSNGAWVDLSYDLSAYQGQAVKFRFRYATDGGVHYAGAFLDNITFTKNGATVWTDTVETADSGWANNGWKRFTGTDTRTVPHFYIAENRTYFSYDDSLRTGPYNYGWADTKPDWVERFSNPEGMLVWYVNYAYGDNNTSVHPGHGLVLPVDVRPGRITVPGVGDITNRRSSFDATFGKQKKKAITLHLQGKPVTVPAMKGVPVFDDSNPDRYWTADNPRNSVKVAGSGTRIEVFLEARGLSDVIVVKTTN
ncbi:MAG TPA: protease, partial [Pilimelia sp.]|nr:protease [Pilimelia sp.]